MTRPGTGLVVVVLAALLGGCAGLPEHGPVVPAAQPEPSGTAAPFDFNPPGPRPGAGRTEIVAGFLNALQATPVTTQVAAQFLSAEAADQWQPGHRTIVYATERVRRRSETVRVDLSGTNELNSRGRWVGGRQGATTTRDRTMRLRLVQEEGQWRLANPPDAMVIPQSHFVARYREYSVFFFDPTASTVVPEPVFLPWGVQAPTRLVSALLQGPPRGAGAAERSYLPRDTELEVSVPVSDGVAQVPLSRQLLDLDERELDLALAQLAWTLRQVPEVKRMQVTVDGAGLELPDGGQGSSVGGWSAYSPAGQSASTDVFGVRGDQVRQQLIGGEEIEAASLAALDASFGPPRSLGVDMSGQRFAVVSRSGTRVAVISRSAPADEEIPQLVTTDALRPMWDLTGRLWVIDRTSSGATISVLRGGRLVSLLAPGLDGSRLAAAALSRDGTRLAAVRRTGSGAQLVVARVVRSTSGTPLALTRAQPVATAAPMTRPRSVGWRDPTTIAVLTRPSRTTSQVVLAGCDGSPASAPLQPSVGLFFGAARAVVSSPGGPMALLLAGPQGRLHALDPQGRWDLDVVEPGLRTPTFVG